MTESCRPRGQVRVGGELWQARCDAGADPGAAVRVTAVDGSRSWSSWQPHEYRLAPPAGGGDPGPGVVDRRAPLHVPGVVARARAAAWRLRSDRARRGWATCTWSSTLGSSAGTLDAGRGGDSAGAALMVGVARGDGVVLEGDGAPFHDEPSAPATPPRRSMPGSPARRPTRAALDVGELRSRRRCAVRARRGRLRPPHVLLRPVRLGQDVRARHGARAAAARDVAADRRPRPELRLRPPRPRCAGDVGPSLARATRRLRRALEVRAGRGAAAERLHVRFARAATPPSRRPCCGSTRSRDREEYGALVELLESGARRRPERVRRESWSLCSARPSRGTRRSGRGCATSASTAGRSGRAATRTRAPGPRRPGGPRCLVVDLGSLGTPERAGDRGGGGARRAVAAPHRAASRC